MTVGSGAVTPPLPPDADQLTLLGGGRIWEQNARPMLEMLALYAGSGLDPREWGSAERQLVGTTDGADDGWYIHPIQGGVARLVIVMARSVDEGGVVLRVWGDERADLGERIDTLLDICTMYRLAPGVA